MLFAQGSITGKLLDEEAQPLPFATITIQGTTKGTSADIDGNFKIENVESGTYTLVFSYVGYNDLRQEVNVGNGPLELGAINLNSSALGLEEIKVVASIAVDRQTPVAVSTIDAQIIEDKVGNQELPEILKSTPSVYTTKGGGGFGDSRINIRGFDQRNTAVLINGIPVNDMENGWVYWSNWAGLSDVTRMIQVQRGLGASKLAINSVGGTMNLITKTTDAQAGGSAFFNVGNDGYVKYGLTASTGRLKGGWAVTLSGSRTTGNGYVDAAWIDAYSYFGSVTKEFGDEHRLTLTAFGAPQKHGQRTNRLDLEPLGQVTDADRRRNDNWGYLNGQIYNIRKNFYHKPQFALNHSWEKPNKFFWTTSVYYSIGRGGGTGDRGRIDGRGTWGHTDENGLIPFDDIVAWNSGTDTGFFSDPANTSHSDTGFVATERNGIIRRASMNEHNWFGGLSTIKLDLTSNLSLMAGVDLRRYTGLHYRKVDDLLGNDTWLDIRDINNQGAEVDANNNGNIDWHESGALKGVGEKIHYDNDGIVDWEGVFTQLEYTSDFGLSAFVALSGSSTGYKRVDRFQYTPEEEKTKRYNYWGYTTKAGANYNIDKMHNVYVNAGYYSRAPGFDAVFPNFDNTPNEGALNEKVIGAELGYGLRAKNVSANVNLYYTFWNDKIFFDNFEDTLGNEFTANITGINALHRGIEFDLNWRPVRGLNVNGMVSIGDWEWRDNVRALISDEDNVVVDEVNVYANGLKVGDAAQFTMAAGLRYEFNFGLGFDVDATYFANLYASFDPVNRQSETLEGIQPIRLPSYGLIDGGLFYKFKINGYSARVRFNMNNVMDKYYIADANDRVNENPNDVRLFNTTGYYGFGRTWNIGIKFGFHKQN